MGRVTKQCRALDNHNYYVLISQFLCFTPYEFNLLSFCITIFLFVTQLMLIIL